MKKILILLLITIHLGIYAADEHCLNNIQPSLDPSEKPTINEDCEIASEEVLPVVKFQPEIRTEQIIQSDYELKQKALERMNAFTKNHRYEGRDNTNANNRYQFNLDNFHLPVFICTLPRVRTDVNVNEHYDLMKIAIAEDQLKTFFHCLNQSGETDRDAFKNLITNKLDGQLQPHEGNNIKWAVLPEYTEQTQDIMSHINQLYAERYAAYQEQHNNLRRVIKQWNQQQ